MRAVVCRKIADPRAIAVEEVPPPVAGPGEVVVAVEAAGVTFVDALILAGGYQTSPAVPYVPGSQVAGTVLACGEDVEGLAPGTRVMALCGQGAFAEQATAPATDVWPIDDGVDTARAAVVPQAYITALLSLQVRGGLRPGERVLVLGAAGGVGLACVEVAAAMGADVIGVASTAAKRAAVEAAGARVALEATDDLRGPVRAVADGGVDVVVDPVGGAASPTALRCLRDEGRLLVVGFASGDIPSVPLNQVLLRNRSVVGVELGGWRPRHPEESRALGVQLARWLSEGTLRPPAPHAAPLDQVHDVLARVRDRATVGRIVLVP